jgi:RNA polymerase sigma-70 factor (ECF subfamily)
VIEQPTTVSEVESDLLMRAQSGDRSAFEDLQHRLEPALRRFIRRLVGRGNSVDDILQDTFFALYMNLDQIEPPAKLRPFMFRVARNRCYDELRRQGRFELVALAEEPGDAEEPADSIVLADDNPLPDETAHWLLIYGEVQAALAQLPELQRQTLLLYTDAELSYAEIAETMDVSIGTVKSRLFHAKRNLVKLLSPETLDALGIAMESESDHV